jgi:hypothetical protein
MTRSADEVKIEIGFAGGGGTNASITAKEWSSFQEVLESGGGWHTMTTRDDTKVFVNLSSVAWVRVAVPSRTLGFSGA